MRPRIRPFEDRDTEAMVGLSLRAWAPAFAPLEQTLGGEISMLAVDPDHQGRGIGTTLTGFALDRLEDAGMKVTMVETGGDPGHAPAPCIREGRLHSSAGSQILQEPVMELQPYCNPLA